MRTAFLWGKQDQEEGGPLSTPRSIAAAALRMVVTKAVDTRNFFLDLTTHGRLRVRLETELEAARSTAGKAQAEAAASRAAAEAAAAQRDGLALQLGAAEETIASLEAALADGQARARVAWAALNPMFEGGGRAPEEPAEKEGSEKLPAAARGGDEAEVGGRVVGLPSRLGMALLLPCWLCARRRGGLVFSRWAGMHEDW